MRIAVIDDHPIVWQGIKAIMASEEDMDLAGYATCGKDAEQLFRRETPDLALVDLRLPGEYGVDLIRNLKTMYPSCRYVVLTTFVTNDDVQNALQADVDGYILKDAFPEDMIMALRTIRRGRRYFDPSVAQMMVVRQHHDGGVASLTEREAEVLDALAQGLNNRAIAHRLFVSENTVKKHISSILAKLELQDRTQAALFAVSNRFRSGMQDNVI